MEDAYMEIPDSNSESNVEQMEVDTAESRHNEYSAEQKGVGDMMDNPSELGANGKLEASQQMDQPGVSCSNTDRIEFYVILEKFEGWVQRCEDQEEVQANISGFFKGHELRTDPSDFVWVHVALDVEPDITKDNRWKATFEKALQTKLNDLGKEKQSFCDVTDLQLQEDPRCALGKIMPASAFDDLLKLGSAELFFKKECITVKVNFSKPPPLSADRSQSSDSRKSHGAEDGQNGPKPDENNESIYQSHTDPGTSNITFNIPPYHFWHLTKIYGKEVHCIERENGVQFSSIVSMTVTSTKQKEGMDSIVKAKNEFLKCAIDFKTVTILEISLQSGSLDKLLMEIQRDKSRLELSVTAEGFKLTGPEESLSRIQRELGLKFNKECDSGIMKSDIGPSRMLEIAYLHDSLVRQVLDMNKTHWEFITHVFAKQVLEIKQKFGVDFIEIPSSDRMTVRAQQVEGLGKSQEIHALSALEHLYQKVATSIMSCTLKNPLQANKVKDTFEQIRSNHPKVAAGEENGPWRLLGLPEHLSHAVSEIGEILGGSVFNEKVQMIHLEDDANVIEALGGHAEEAEEDKCPICMDTFKNKTKLHCSHEFCTECMKQAEKSMGPRCPVCKKIFGIIEGDQPEGEMKYRRSPQHLPGFQNYRTIVIDYFIPGGLQKEKHPNPGMMFSGTQRTAYLPDSPEGNEVLNLLQKAFHQKLIFTVGVSRTTGESDTVTWNDIHHKTSIHGGPSRFGYPDPDYLKRVKEELKAKGIE